MADDNTDPLEQVAGLFQTDAGQAYANEAATRINDFVQRRDIADANTRAGDALVGNLADMQGNLVGMVQNDPTATNLALDLARLGTRAVVDQIPGADPEHADAITADMHRNIAGAAVKSAAELHEGLAQSLLGDDRISNALGDERPHYENYIVAQTAARKIDSQAAQQEAQRQFDIRADKRAYDYLNAVTDDNGQVRFPQDYAKRVMSDPSMPTQTKAALVDAYGRLMENGDVDSSRPDIVRDIVRSIGVGGARPSDILSHAGENLTFGDATTLMGLALSPKSQRYMQAIDTHLQAAQRQLAAPENGPAGQVAFDNFTKWAVGAARNGADFDPTSKDYILQGNRMEAFQPQAADYADMVVGQMNRKMTDWYVANLNNTWDKPSLGDIFSAKRRPPPGDTVLQNTHRAPPVNLPTARQETDNPMPSVDLGSRFAAPPRGGDEVLHPEELGEGGTVAETDNAIIPYRGE